MHPVQAAPRQRKSTRRRPKKQTRCTPCRQRRGKVQHFVSRADAQHRMHPVQAAPRQRAAMARRLQPARKMHPVQAAPRQRAGSNTISRFVRDAPRAGSAEAKTHDLFQPHKAGKGAPRAGSAEAKQQANSLTVDGIAMHPVQAAHSEITTCRPMVL